MNIRKSLLAGLSALSLLGACSFSGAGAAPVSGVPVKNVLSVRQDAPEVSDLRTGRGALDSLIKLGKREDGEKPVFIPSTARVFEQPFLEDWAAARGMRFRVTGHDFGGAAPDDIPGWARANKPGMDYLAETSIRKWGVKTHPRESSHRVAFISLNHKLTDLKSGEILVNRNCVRDTKDRPQSAALTVHKLLKDDRALLKDIMENLTASCLDAVAKSHNGV